MKKLFIILTVVMLLFALVISGCAQPTSAPSPAPTPTPAPTPEAKTFKIGVTLGLTGPGSQHDLMYRDAAQLCADWINNNGGVTVKGEKYLVELIFEDGKQTPPGYVDAATKLVHLDKVSFITGCNIPVMADSVSSVTEKEKVLYMAFKTAMVTPDKPYTFAGTYNHTSMLPSLYDAMLEKYPAVKSVGYIVEDETGARIFSEVAQGIAKQHGLTIVEPQDHPFEVKEYYPQWTKLISLNPDAVDMGVKMPDTASSCLKQGRELGYKGPMCAHTPADPHLILNMIGKDYATDFIYPSFDPYDTKNTPSSVQEIIKLWESTYDYPIDPDGTEPWDCVWCLTQAIEKAQSFDVDDVKNALQNMGTLETSRGTAKIGGLKTFGINNMVFGPGPLMRFKDGNMEFIKWVDPWLP